MDMPNSEHYSFSVSVPDRVCAAASNVKDFYRIRRISLDTIDDRTSNVFNGTEISDLIATRQGEFSARCGGAEKSGKQPLVPIMPTCKGKG